MNPGPLRIPWRRRRPWWPATLVLLIAASAVRADDPGSDLRAAAALALRDVVGHWWVGDATSGHLQPTHGGCAVDKGRGVIWERATVMCVFETFSSMDGDGEARDRICAQWRHDQSGYKPKELRACGPGTIAPWCDDAAWQVVYYVIAYQQSGDPDALSAAADLIEQIHAHWWDWELGGGLWYNDQRKVKSLYGVAYVYGALGIYQATGNRRFLDLARAEYDWIEEHLLRADHLYWCDYLAATPGDPHHPARPGGQDRPDDIRTAGSVTYLGGNLGMAACQAWLYELTGESHWREASIRTAAAIHEHLRDSAGCFINDRDAFTNGFFVSAWARRAAGLPGCGATLEDLRRTARAIAERRTGAGYQPVYGPGGEGYYPGDWDGGGRWESKESMANMMHVSAASVSFLAASACLPTPR